ncbi:MAG TPA: cyclopropane-fatty-acyl-phospholipid synthase family protein [Bacteroidota bacterium]|nr:cyclopropane-fatty-acyl-phospholipid synthase family protein [Bacteroidota bacterium]
MHNTEVLEYSKPVPALRSFYEPLVLKALEGMNNGSLLLTFPDGEKMRFGESGSTLQATVRVVRPGFFRKCLLYGDVGFGEAYVDGDWETDDIAKVISWFLLNADTAPTISGTRRRMWILNLLKVANRFAHLVRDNTPRGSRRNIRAHYDLSNDFFRMFLDPGMTYSSAYFAAPGLSLEQAQTEKYDRLCRQLHLQSKDHVLEIGSGWGGFAIHAARKYGCRVTTVTVSEKQFEYTRERIRLEGLEDRVEIRFQDYRTITGSYDKIVSIEMLEAVGHRHMETFFAKCHAVLKKDGLLGLQVIAAPDSRYDSLRKGVDWIQKHIFPGSLLPSIARINRAINRTGDMTLHDIKDLGLHYARTLQQWRDNFNRNGDKIRDLGFDERFRRKWNYYFSYCEAAFAMRNISVLQMVYARPNNALLRRPTYDMECR